MLSLNKRFRPFYKVVGKSSKYNISNQIGPIPRCPMPYEPMTLRDGI